ncbi:hypothetical protein VF13_11990 [Nostoc linckia z16]|nr:hypothetical protein VF13_11990 [Nostoc linckia z16]
MLGRVVVRPGMIAGDRHGPGVVACFQPLQELGRVFDVQRRVEHRVEAGELVAVVVMVDLHAADVDQLLALGARGVELVQCLLLASAEEGAPMDVERVGLQRITPAAFGQTDRIEHADGNVVGLRDADHVLLAHRLGGGRREQARDSDEGRGQGEGFRADHGCPPC